MKFWKLCLYSSLIQCYDFLGSKIPFNTKIFIILLPILFNHHNSYYRNWYYKQMFEGTRLLSCGKRRKTTSTCWRKWWQMATFFSSVFSAAVLTFSSPGWTRVYSYLLLQPESFPFLLFNTAASKLSPVTKILFKRETKLTMSENQFNICAIMFFKKRSERSCRI